MKHFMLVIKLSKLPNTSAKPHTVPIIRGIPRSVKSCSIGAALRTQIDIFYRMHKVDTNGVNKNNKTIQYPHPFNLSILINLNQHYSHYAQHTRLKHRKHIPGIATPALHLSIGIAMEGNDQETSS